MNKFENISQDCNNHRSDLKKLVNALQSLITKISERLFLDSGADHYDFSPAIVRLQDKPPSPLSRRVLKTAIALFCIMLLWGLIGRLDIVAVADGKLVPQSYLQIVQPAEQGIVNDILVREGESVKQGLLHRVNFVGWSHAAVLEKIEA